MLQQSKLAAQGELISNIAHQWRQPLNIAATTIQNLKMLSDLGHISPEDIDNAVTVAMHHIQNLSEIINKFSYFFASQDDRSVFSINREIGKTVELLESHFRAHRITVLREGSELSVNGFVNDFKQVMLVLLNNAADAIIKRQESDRGF